MVSIAREINLTPLGKKVLNYLRTKGAITPLVAWSLYDTMRLSDVIHKLRNVGYEITTEMKTDEEGTNYASYSLAVPVLAN